MQITPGRNIAIKVPAHRWDEMVAFYRERVGLAVRRDGPDNIAFAFGEITLWLDRVPQQSQVDVWLELIADDPDAALAHLGSPERDELEPLEGVEGHWTSDPAGVVLLLRKD
ncbi:VOC family protein [Tabrizicola aquatica]|uniref:VOC family protein n=1 Tax=Tabrizicola aquatica TaxID=909926 RepID=UPI000CD12385|nr:VOC family protein [Tabrizicola aquatica]